jgi:POT family proton-dependent oligopeptide transporter
MKFSLGIFQLGLGFLVTIIGLQFVDENNMVPLLTLVFLYLMHTSGELFLSPIGLSMVTKLAPKAIAGTAMGGWFLSFAIANYAGGLIASLTGGHGGEGPSSAAEGLTQYTDIFSTIGYVLVVFAIMIALLSKPLNKLMHGVR